MKIIFITVLTNTVNMMDFSECPIDPHDLTKVENKYDPVNPKHYLRYGVEVIDMMVSIWGKAKTADHCEMTAFKYRQRMGTKPNNPIEQDLEKENWYLEKAKELRT